MIAEPRRDAWPVWLWPNLLGLDAPIVAVTWQGFLASCYSLPLRPAARIGLGLTVWAIYLADRILDVRQPAGRHEAARHRFARAHPKFMATLLGVVLLVDAAWAADFLRPALLVNGLIPLAGVVAYLAVFHGPVSRIRPSKEASAAVLFTGGTFLAGWTNARSPLQLTGPAVAFCLLCLANLVAIEMWEWRELRRGELEPHAWTLWLGRAYPIWVAALAAACLALGRSPWYRVVALSAVLTALLFHSSTRLPIEARRASIDLLLLTPWLTLL
jgi:hypothetical protein